jgi:hypothetical protein
MQSDEEVGKIAVATPVMICECYGPLHGPRAHREGEWDSQVRGDVHEGPGGVHIGRNARKERQKSHPQPLVRPSTPSQPPTTPNKEEGTERPA